MLLVCCLLCSIELLHFFKLCLELFGDLCIFESNGECLSLWFQTGKVLASPCPASIGSRVWLQLYICMHEMIETHFECFVLTQKNANLASILVLEKLDIALASLLPLIRSGVESVKSRASEQPKRKTMMRSSHKCQTMSK